MATEESSERLVALLEQIAARLESIDNKLSGIHADADLIAQNTSPLAAKPGDHADRVDSP